MLSEKSRPVIEATAAVVARHRGGGHGVDQPHLAVLPREAHGRAAGGGGGPGGGGDMGRHRHARMRPEWMAGRQRLGAEDVQHGMAQPSLVQRRQQGLVVQQASLA